MVEEVTMSSVNISLDDTALAHAQQQVGSGRFQDINAYISTLIQQDQRQQSAIEVEISRRLAKNDVSEFTRADWDSIRAEVVRRHQARAAK